MKKINMHKKLYFPIIFLTILAFGLELVNINLSSRLASDSMAVKKLQDQIAAISEHNEILNTKVLDLTSFETLASRAADLGFVQANNYISLGNQVKLSYSR